MSAITSLTRSWLARSFRPFRFTGSDGTLPCYRDVANLGLYIHIPFCRSLCSFCPYCREIYQEKTARDYVAALQKEIALVGRGNTSRKKVSTLYFGGGTPALVANELNAIIKTVETYFEISEGIGLELHPSDVTPETLRRLKAAGVTRISIGVQSFDPGYLALLGRDGHNDEAMFAALREVPFETVSMDFIFALPGQTFESVRKDIDTAFGNGANQIALYPFIDFSHTSREFAKMSEPDKKKLLAEITQYCRRRDFQRGSIWTFSLPGTPKYSSMTRDNFLGFGCSATTLLPDRFTINTFSIPAYLERLNSDRLPSALTLKFSLRQRMLYYLFWTAYTMEIDSEAFASFFGVGLERCYRLELLLARACGLICKTGTKYRMTPRGAYYYHYYEHFYTLSYIDKMWNLMRRNAFPDELTIR